MNCSNTIECFEQISAYFNGDKTGSYLLINTENYDVYQEILQRLQADATKSCVYISDNCFPNGLPDVDAAIAKTISRGEYALVGLSQALMIQGDSALEAKIDEILGKPISGYCVVLLDHCEKVLQKFLRRDIRVEKRVVLVEGEVSTLPTIRIAASIETCIGFNPLSSIPRLLAYLEKLTELQRDRHPEITVVSSLPTNLFSRAVYSITPAAGIYEALSAKYSDIAGATEEKYGSDTQWGWLANQMKKHTSFSSLVCDVFGATTNLSAHIADVMGNTDKNQQWLLWLAMKVFGVQNNKYLTLVLNQCENVDSFAENCFMALVDVSVDDAMFSQYYTERKRLVEQLPENLPLTSKFCEKLGIHQRDAIYYLTDSSDSERYAFVQYLDIYSYSRDEVLKAAKRMSKSLAMYMQNFVFDTVNTKLPESDSGFRSELTDYFNAYKLQKLTNKIQPEFLDVVNSYALSRPYNKLQPRSSIISHMDKKNVQLFFFDALGVEYLAFILAKCEEYGLVSEVAIGHCELPSITSKNKEFLQYFSDENWCKIDDLDEMKHHSQIYNYQKCEYPIHLFEELDVIDEQLRRIQSMLVQGTIEKALIVADHGASRLAVRYGHESSEAISLEESGEHSGRCCPVDEDPKLQFAAYEDGFSVLANYERFKGGRRANVEVHGGASLEEVVVPIITLSKRPDNIEICFVNSVIILKPRIIPELTLYSNIPLQKPRILVDGEYYEGEFVADKKHAKFELPKIKRKGTYHADIYDGDKNMSVTLEFRAQKQTHEVDLL